MITTSYFAKLKFIDNPIAITIKPPNWYKGGFYKKLSPPGEIVFAYKNNEINTEEYSKLYYEFVLDKLNAEEIYKEIVDKFGSNATLLCYEKPSDFCHRHLVRDWFNKFGFNIQELEF